MKKSVKDQTARAFQTGGYNAPVVPQPTQPYSQPTQVDPRTGTYTLPGTGIAGYQVPSGTPTGYTPYGGATPYFQPVQFTGAQYQTALQTTNLPTFAETVGSKLGQYDELRTYINDAGQTLQIPFKDGRPIYPIPEGYRPIGDQPAPEEEAPTTVTPTLGQAQVMDEGGDRDTGFVGTGYQGLSTTKVSGGLTEASAKAKADLGITGYAGHSIGSMMAFAGSALGILGATSLAGKESLGFIGAVEPTQGYTGTISQSEIRALANVSPAAARVAGYSMTPEQARNVMNAQAQYGVTLNGVIGYQTGNISPTYGTAVKNGMTVNSAYGGNQAEYSSVTDMLNTVQKGIEAGWRGGYIDKDTYDDLSAKAKTNYDNFDNTHKGYDIIKEDPEALRAYQRGNMPQDNQITGTPTRTDVSLAKSMADKAFEQEQKAFEAEMAKAGKPDVSDATPAPSSRDEGGSGGRGGSEAGDPSGGAGEGSGTDCLTEKMKVKLNGVIDFVTNIKVGDIIDGFVVKEVLHKHMRSGYFVINNELEITNDHPVLANGTWTKPEELYIGDYINDVKVESIKYIDRMTPTVSIVVDGDSFDVYTEGNTYTVHGRYREVRKQAA
jgi:hypothetical protein